MPPHRIEETGDFSQCLDHDDDRRGVEPDGVQWDTGDMEQPQDLGKEEGTVDNTRKKRRCRRILIVVAVLVILFVIILSVVLSKSDSDTPSTSTGNGAPSTGSLTQVGTPVYGQVEQELLGSVISLSYDGKFMAAGAPGFNGNFNGDQVGKVVVYSLDGSNSWVQYGPTLVGGADLDLFGSGVSLSGDGSLLLVGAPREKGYGYVKAFKFDGSNWNQQGSQLVAPGLFTAYGQTVVVSQTGEVIAIGSPKQTIGTQGNRAGMVNVLRWNGTEWEPFGDPIAGLEAMEMFSSSLALSADGNVVAVGAPFNSAVSDSSGKVRVFRYNKFADGGWELMGNSINGQFQMDRAGTSVTLSGDGNTLGISLVTQDQRGGEVRVYRYDTERSDWTKVGKGVTGEHPFTQQGFSIALSADGSTLATGAPRDSNNGHQYDGLVQVYEVTNDVWIQVGADLYGETDNDNFGKVVALSGDGKFLAAGAPTKSHTFSYDPQGLSNTGYIRTYQVNH